MSSKENNEETENITPEPITTEHLALEVLKIF